MGTSLEGSRKSYFSGLVMKINELPTPCFVIDETKLIHNLEILKEVEGPFDMIFMDAAKGQYKLFYDMIIDKLRVDGLLISDNILYKGMVAHDDFVIRRKKTIVKRMRNYLDYICNCDYLSTSLIPIGDGVALSYKNNKRGDINA